MASNSFRCSPDQDTPNFATALSRLNHEMSTAKCSFWTTAKSHQKLHQCLPLQAATSSSVWQETWQSAAEELYVCTAACNMQISIWPQLRFKYALAMVKTRANLNQNTWPSLAWSYVTDYSFLGALVATNTCWYPSSRKFSCLAPPSTPNCLDTGYKGNLSKTTAALFIHDGVTGAYAAQLEAGCPYNHLAWLPQVHGAWQNLQVCDWFSAQTGALPF